MKYHSGILDGWPEWDEDEVRILANTPGIPIRWIYAALKLNQYRRKDVREMVGTDKVRGRENAESVVFGDGWKMLLAVCPNYRGPAPYWSTLELQMSQRKDWVQARRLGVSRHTIARWRKGDTTVWDIFEGPVAPLE